MSEPTAAEIVDRMKQHVRDAGHRAEGDFSAASGTPGAYRDALQRELMAVHALAGAVGQINPRPAGIRNQAIQLFKRIIRRTLTWYTRPLHEFHGAVARALQEQARAIAHLSQKIEEQKRKLNEQTHIQASDHTSAIDHRLGVLEDNMGDLLGAQKEQRGPRS